MLQSLQQLLGLSRPAIEESADHRLRLATAALFIEMNRADFEVDQREQTRTSEALSLTFELTPEEVDELLEKAELQSREAIEVFQFTRVLDRELSSEEKIDVVQRLWEIAFADETLDEQEEYLVRKIANLLHVPHPDFIAAKQRARKLSP